MGKYVLNDVFMFVTAVEAGTLSAAAKELGVPASTVSRSLTRLERGLEILLINRSSKGFILTDAGTDYLRSCRHALRALKDGTEQLDRHRRNPRGMIRLICPGTMIRHLLTPIMGKLVNALPDMRIDLQDYTPRHVPLPRVEMDIIFTVTPPNDSSRMIRAFPCSIRGLFATENTSGNAGFRKLRWN